MEKKLASIMAKHSIKTKELAEATNKSNDTIASLRSGRSNASIELWKDIQSYINKVTGKDYKLDDIV